MKKKIEEKIMKIAVGYTVVSFIVGMVILYVCSAMHLDFNSTVKNILTCIFGSVLILFVACCIYFYAFVEKKPLDEEDKSVIKFGLSILAYFITSAGLSVWLSEIMHMATSSVIFISITFGLVVDFIFYKVFYKGKDEENSESEKIS